MGLTKYLILSLPILVTVQIILRRQRAHARAREFKALNPSIPVTAMWFDIFFLQLFVLLKVLPQWLFVYMTGLDFEWVWSEHFKQYENTEHAAVAIATPDRILFFTADPDTTREIASKGNDFPKPIHNYGLLDIFGKNIVTVEHDEWRRHRRIVAPRFGEKNNALVHEQTALVVQDMFKSWEKDVAPGSSFTVNVTNDMRKLALLVISSAGFGRYLKWEEDSNGVKTTGGHRMTFLKSLEVSVNNISLYMVTPKWVLNYAPIPMLRETKTGFEEFKSYLLEYIRTASEDKTARAKDNLLSSLVSSRSDPDVKGTLSESEVLGNVWIFMFAGHETTASTLAYAIALLGFYPEKQAKLHRFVDEVLKGRIPTYKEAGELHYVFAIMNETLRLFPPVINVPKWTARSPKTLSNGIQLPADTSINLNVAALHYHPRAWAPDPEAFRPERWNAPPSTSPTSASDEHSPTRATSQHPPGSFIPFSDGPRACIGKRFSQVEFVCALALIAQRYSWKPVPGAKLEETLESESRLTLRTVKDVEMIFTKRAV